MKHVLDAVYERGVLKPLASVDLAEGQRACLTIETTPDGSPDDMLELAAHVPGLD